MHTWESILWLNHTSEHVVQPQHMGTQGSSNHTVTKFAAFVHIVCDTVCTKFCSKQTTFEKVIVKIHKPKFADPSMAAVSPYFVKSMMCTCSVVSVHVVHVLRPRCKMLCTWIEQIQIIHSTHSHCVCCDFFVSKM